MTRAVISAARRYRQPANNASGLREAGMSAFKGASTDHFDSTFQSFRRHQWRRDRDPARIGALACKKTEVCPENANWLAVANRFSHKKRSQPADSGFAKNTRKGHRQ